MRRNPHFFLLKPQYLFSEISKKLTQFRNENPLIPIIDLSIGDTTQPLNPSITQAVKDFCISQEEQETYRGYGPETGLEKLREKIALEVYTNRVSPEEIFISDGAKPDIFRLFSLFGTEKVLGLQNPVYPAYRDIAYITGIKKIISLPSSKETGFIPELPEEKSMDILCLCYPNNPTGAILTFKQLQLLVEYANHHGIVVIFDAAYSTFISDPSLPKSIFEIPEAKYCAIEVNSFSKPLGFTGMRLGWNVVPKELTYDNGDSIIDDWKRLFATTFNGASLAMQEAGYRGLDLFPTPPSIAIYLQNAHQLKKSLEISGFLVHGGDHAPYLWVELPEEVSDEDAFDFFLNQYHIAVTPGYGFGTCGERFVRLSAFAEPQNITLACKQLLTNPLHNNTMVLV
ncbi:LL-diaminopimelate aminotransferase,L,L-diaminopimelate aminotransferase,Alanine-alpha-ketoisovalerate (or valine-pyruvate) aminotransferase,LL-diaminopimelate aminotransferase,Aminotransferase class I and II [Chlamydia serpentis]|uniref:LL-diaminopimelate aminotransferase n=1 Tax=Chlamydia serpentis TaxID=1967782 RepID=A0A2R8FB09_9CHLA|nr:LL-diaminopimelate aminotransferase [Chlamydia serpentis]SPN73615.1 LL-diaminopimelate aminotransferase,L,L-diaminopimelate aminotransferase,Alanine-alpha-ketoisovalerate (or valine-pyruvate) aminotransferase,LL-diaminopimelate aminotransferase,Aminotransferase class I and II [Chlamydia serpentis]